MSIYQIDYNHGWEWVFASSPVQAEQIARRNRPRAVIRHIEPVADDTLDYEHCNDYEQGRRAVRSLLR